MGSEEFRGSSEEGEYDMARKLTGHEMWIVSYVKWQTKRNGRLDMRRTYSRAFRTFIDANRQYRAIKNSLADAGYKLTDASNECYNECECVRGYVRNDKTISNSSDFVVLYLLRNEPLYD